MLLNPTEHVLVCDNCLTRKTCQNHVDLCDPAPGSWQTVWLFVQPDDDEGTEKEGRVDACSEFCRHELEADGLWPY